MKNADTLLFVKQIRAYLGVIDELRQVDVKDDVEGIAIQDAIRGVLGHPVRLCARILEESKREMVIPLRGE